MSLRDPTSVILKSEGRASWGSLIQHSNLGDSDEPRRDQKSNCHTLSINISHQVTALGEQILNHARPSLFRMT